MKRLPLGARNLIAAATVCAITTTVASAQQIPLPTTAAQVPGPAPGTAMTKPYVQMVGRMAYFWGYALVANASRAIAYSKVPEPGLLGGVAPTAYNRLAMLTDYIAPDQHYFPAPNQDVVYGTGFFDLDKEPAVIQVPDFGDRFWVYAFYDGRTDEFVELGKQYGTRPGFYLAVGPNWQGATPAGITAAVHSSTRFGLLIPRVFMDDTAEDRRAVQPLLSRVNAYPLSEFDGTMKVVDWSKLPNLPAPKGAVEWVNPDTFFDELPAVMKQVPPLPGEEALYAWINSVIVAAANDPEIRKTLVEAATEADNEMISPLFQWRYNGPPAGNGWNSVVNAAQWGTDYLNRTATAKSNIYDNRPNETKYIYTESASDGTPLNGQNTYTVTFGTGEIPPVRGFWSLTLYNAEHFFHPNALNRYSLGTKNKTLKYNADGSLTLYVGDSSPGADKESNWLPAPSGSFTLCIRAYWAERPILDGQWRPPVVKRVQ